MEMTAGELIDYLENFHPDKRVLLRIGSGGGFWSIVDVMAYDGFPILCILEPGK